MLSSKSVNLSGKAADVSEKGQPSNDLETIKAGHLPRRLTMTTLGVADVPTSRSFYERLGFKAADFDSADVCFFETSGSILGLYGRKALAEDAKTPDDGSGFRGVALALNLDSEAAVDAALSLAEQAGATIAKRAEHVFWGGYSGYFADPDGHLWEVAYNPMAPLDSNGRLTLPAPASPEPGTDT